MTYDEVVAVALAFPGVAQSTSYGTPSLKVGAKFLLRLVEPDIIALKRPSIDERDMLIEAEPDLFFLTDHYRPYPYLLVRLAPLRKDHFEALFRTIWRENATKSQVRAYASR